MQLAVRTRVWGYSDVAFAIPCNGLNAASAGSACDTLQSVLGSDPRGSPVGLKLTTANLESPTFSQPALGLLHVPNENRIARLAPLGRLGSQPPVKR